MKSIYSAVYVCAFMVMGLLLARAPFAAAADELAQGTATSAEILRPNTCVDLKVRASDPWNRSGKILEKGEIYTLRVKSITEPWVDDSIPATPADGWTTWHRFLYWPIRFLARCPSRNWYTLIGAIGTSSEQFFYIGDGVEHIATTSGEFMSFSNDKRGRYGNNHGSLILELCRQ